LDPKPRDYRRGVFKFAAVDPGSKPRRADLLRTLVHGLPGSAMPSFRRSALADLHALIDYVRYLAIRGEVESRLAAEWEIAEIRPRDAIAEQYELVWRRWLEAEAHGRTVVAPPVDPEPARRALGDEVFHDTRRGNCVTCHGPAGRGDGVSALGVDAGGHRYTLLRDEWQNPILPRDLARGIFRGGSSREDIYLRIHCGIPGTPMPSLGSSLDARGEPLLSEREKWAVVDYVLSLSGRGPFASAAPR
jgi:mono/diheme cytochrome c family protein